MDKLKRFILSIFKYLLKLASKSVRITLGLELVHKIF